MERKKIIIIDYGMGNVGSVAGALDYLEGNYSISSQRSAIVAADALILPGVGAFGAAMDNLRKLDLLDALSEEVLKNKKPFFGICLGMQLLAKDSIEQGFHKGLGWIDGHVLAMKSHNNFRVPHVGWNNVDFKQDNSFFKKINEGAHFYFDHSFHLSCKQDLVVADCYYGESYVAAIQKENIFASQFHPEKSQRNGLRMLRNFLNFIEQPNVSGVKAKC